MSVPMLSVNTLSAIMVIVMAPDECLPRETDRIQLSGKKIGFDNNDLNGDKKLNYNY
jgi:hypothetical protein